MKADYYNKELSEDGFTPKTFRLKNQIKNLAIIAENSYFIVLF